jgi:hypothetical protein
MDQEQKDRIIETVEQAAFGLITKSELIRKLEEITAENFEETIA